MVLKTTEQTWTNICGFDWAKQHVISPMMATWELKWGSNLEIFGHTDVTSQEMRMLSQQKWQRFKTIHPIFNPK